MNPCLSPEQVHAQANVFVRKIQSAAFDIQKVIDADGEGNTDPLQNDVSAVAEFLYTSGKKGQCCMGMELSSILNWILRDDVEAEIKAVVGIVRAINIRRV